MSFLIEITWYFETSMSFLFIKFKTLKQEQNKMPIFVNLVIALKRKMIVFDIMKLIISRRLSFYPCPKSLF